MTHVKMTCFLTRYSRGPSGAHSVLRALVGSCGAVLKVCVGPRTRCAAKVGRYAAGFTGRFAALLSPSPGR